MTAYTPADTKTPLKPKEAEPKPAKLPTITISAVLDGFAIAVSFEGKIDQLPGCIDRLRKLGATPTPQPAQQWSYTPEGLPMCPKHGTPMKKREQQGDTWYSHNVGTKEAPVYCRGYHGKDSPGYEH